MFGAIVVSISVAYAGDDVSRCYSDMAGAVIVINIVGVAVVVFANDYVVIFSEHVVTVVVWFRCRFFVAGFTIFFCCCCC